MLEEAYSKVAVKKMQVYEWHKHFVAIRTAGWKSSLMLRVLSTRNVCKRTML
jgi:hypothetical protein